MNPSAIKLNKKTLIIIGAGATVLALGLWWYKRHTANGESKASGELISSGGASAGGGGATGTELNESREARQNQEKMQGEAFQRESQERQAERAENRVSGERQEKENEAERTLSREEKQAERSQVLAERQQQYTLEHPPGAGAVTPSNTTGISPGAKTPIVNASKVGQSGRNAKGESFKVVERDGEIGHEYANRSGPAKFVGIAKGKPHKTEKAHTQANKTNQGQKGTKKASHRVTTSHGHSANESKTGGQYQNHPDAHRKTPATPVHHNVAQHKPQQSRSRAHASIASHRDVQVQARAAEAHAQELRTQELAAHQRQQAALEARRIAADHARRPAPTKRRR